MINSKVNYGRKLSKSEENYLKKINSEISTSKIQLEDEYLKKINSKKSNTSSQIKTMKKSIWKTFLIWILGIWAMLTLASASVDLFMFFTVGIKITFAQLSVWALALGIILKFGLVRYEPKKKSEKKPKKINNIKDSNLTNKNIRHLVRLDVILKISKIAGIILVTVTIFYYFLIRPNIEEKKYSECVDAIIFSDKFNNDTIITPAGKSFLDICVKTNGAEKIRIEKEDRDAQENAKRLQEEANQKEKELSSDELKKLNIEDIKAEWGEWNNDISFQGKIRNDNSFDVKNIKIKIEIFSQEKSKKNKLEEKEFDLSDIYYARSNKDFRVSYFTRYKSFSYTYTIIKAETDVDLKNRTIDNKMECSNLFDNAKEQCMDLEKKVKLINDMLEFKSKEINILENQLSLIDLNVSISKQEKDEYKKEKIKLLEEAKKEQINYQELLKKTEKQEQELLN